MAGEGKISVAVTGAAGKMGREVVKAVSREPDMFVSVAVDSAHAGQDAGTLAGIGRAEVLITPFLQQALASAKPHVLVDFTRREAALENIEVGLKNKVACVVGTTGFTPEDFKVIAGWCEKYATPALVAPNFAIGAVLLMKFAKEAARYFSSGEIIEFHHEKKADAPSGTAVRTAERMLESRSAFEAGPGEGGSRGVDMGGIRLHSVRLPGFVAHEEVLFGGLGQVLTIRHDSLSRESFMPGVVMAVRKVSGLKGLAVGLESVLP